MMLAELRGKLAARLAMPVGGISILLVLGVALVPSNFKIAGLPFALLWLAGIVLLVVDWSNRRRIDPAWMTASLLLAGGCLMISLVNGDVIRDLRWASYPFYYLAATPFLVGLVLVRDPLGAVVAGARLGIILSVVLALLEFIFWSKRIGFGINAANASFVIAAIATLARIELRQAPAFLPNSLGWFYLAIIPVALTGVRSTLILMLLTGLWDLWRNNPIEMGRRFWSIRKDWRVMLGVAVAALAIAAVIAPPLAKRTVNAVKEVQAAWSAPEGSSGGLSIRLVLWQRSWALIKQDPLTGFGGEESLKQIRGSITKKPGLYKNFIHMHNLVLDELRIRGLLGLLCHVAFFWLLMRRIWKQGSSDLWRNSVIFLLLLVAYGSMHGPLVAERNIAAIILFFMVVLAAIRADDSGFYRREPAAPQG